MLLMNHNIILSRELAVFDFQTSSCHDVKRRNRNVAEISVGARQASVLETVSLSVSFHWKLFGLYLFVCS